MMKNLQFLFYVLLLVGSFAAVSKAQTPLPTRPRIIFGATPRPTPYAAAPQAYPTPTPIIVGEPRPTPAPQPILTPTPAPPSAVPSVSPTPLSNVLPNVFMPMQNPLGKAMSFAAVRVRLAQAKQALLTRPLNTSINIPNALPTANTGASVNDDSDDSSPSVNPAPVLTFKDFVTLAVFEPSAGVVHQVAIPKESYLKKYYEITGFSNLNKPVRVRILRANGVNTAVLASDMQGVPLVPLLVQYPVVKGGAFREMAYYTSAHPALLSTEVVGAGQIYVRTVFDTALQNLKSRGIYIAPEVIEVAERLSIVEHIDHQRFNTEFQPALFEEVYTLFALNEGSTYRYSVSSAGAGGMVQMIPATYRMVRSMNPTVPLIPDFVEGMRNHTNAVTAMLLYMQYTWNDLRSNGDIQDALAFGVATPAELMSAGYNSNPSRLPAYIRRSGNNWRTVIPRETQMYLKIYSAFESAMKLPKRQ